jgi:hypothetical protein
MYHGQRLVLSPSNMAHQLETQRFVLSCITPFLLIYIITFLIIVFILQKIEFIRVGIFLIEIKSLYAR